MRELTDLFSKINTSALASRASHLREGVACTIAPLQYDGDKTRSVMGGMNYHIELCFEDGVRWIARIRRTNTTSPPAALRDYMLTSEVATLQFLEGTGVPAPKVFDFALEGPDNSVGVGYILMEKLPGQPLDWGRATGSQRRKVMDQLADIFIELRRYPFNELGSLDMPGTSHVGGCAQESLTDFETPKHEMLLAEAPKHKMTLAGPFVSLEGYHRYSLQLILDLIVREEMYSQQPVDAYLITRFLLDLIPSVLPSPPPTDQRFYLRHGDDKGDHILVDDDFNVTGIIDWEWAHTASPAHAFNSPIGLLPVGDFYDGVNEIGDDEVVFASLLEEKGHGDLAAYVRAGRLQHRFAFCCGYNLAADWSGFLGLFRGLRDAAKVDGGLDWDEWKALALERYNEDVRLRTLLSKN